MDPRYQLPHSAPGEVDLVDTIEQLAILEACLWHIHEGVAASSPFTSFFCREYWGTSASQAQLSLDKLILNEPLKAHVQMACLLESLSLGVVSHQCTRCASDTTGRLREWLCNLVGNIRGNCLALLSLVRQQWICAGSAAELHNGQHCPANLDFNILSVTRHFRQLCGEAEHVSALNEHNSALWSMLCQLRKPNILMVSSSSEGGPLVEHRLTDGSDASDVLLSMVADTALSISSPMNSFSVREVRGMMLNNLRFSPMSHANPSCPVHAPDPYHRFGSCDFATAGPVISFEPLPPIFTDLSQCPRLPTADPSIYTLVLDLDETLVHHSVVNGSSYVGFRPGAQDFLRCMSSMGWELVIYTAATQNYADACIDMVDPMRVINHRLYRQHALSWGPVFLKDLSRLGRDLSRTLIIDNIQENFMLQPNNGIHIFTWLEDPNDTALIDLIPVLRELITSGSTVPATLEKYTDQMPAWAGWKNGVVRAGAGAGFELGGVVDANAGNVSKEILSVN